VDAVAAHYPVDPARVYLSGWSGGATYIGFQRGDFESRFAAINLSGGGSPPGGGAACAPCPAPVYYLMGDRNPLFASAVATRDFFKGCGHEVEWRLLPGADHGGELRAYSRPEQAASLLAWLSARPKRCPADPAADAGLGDAGRGGGDAGPAAGRDAPQAAESAAAPPAGKREVGTSGAIAEPRIGSRCVCGVAGARGSSGGPAGLAAAMMALLARRRRRVAAPGSRASRVPG
jgi:MYXO-CTERM domain-containing protein